MIVYFAGRGQTGGSDEGEFFIDKVNEYNRLVTLMYPACCAKAFALKEKHDHTLRRADKVATGKPKARK